MAEVPHFQQDGSIRRAPKVWHSSCLKFDSILKLGEGSACLVRRGNTRALLKKSSVSCLDEDHIHDARREHVEGWILVESPDGSIKEVDNLLMLFVR